MKFASQMKLQYGLPEMSIAQSMFFSSTDFGNPSIFASTSSITQTKPNLLIPRLSPSASLIASVVENANILGTPNIRMFSFYVPEGQADAYADEVMRRLDRLAEYAARQGVVLLHENEKAIYGDVAVRCKAILERFSGPHFRAVFDFANFVQCGQDTLEAYELLKPYIAYIHIKDALFDGGRVTPAGWGQGNVKAILADLKAAGYQGYLSLEPHLTDFTGFRSLENGNSGEKWRMDGETAWRVALDSLKAILWELNWQ